MKYLQTHGMMINVENVETFTLIADGSSRPDHKYVRVRTRSGAEIDLKGIGSLDVIRDALQSGTLISIIN